MNEGIEKQSTPERERALKESVLRLVDEIRKANILVPQTYGSVRVAGALSFLKETSTEYDFTPQDLINGYNAQSNEIDRMLTEQMHAAHRPFNIKPEAFAGKNETEVVQRIHDLLGHHLDVALTATGDALLQADEMIPDGYEGTSQDFTISLMQPIYDALYHVDMREAIRDYRKDIAEDRVSREEFAEELTAMWLQIYINLLEERGLMPDDPKQRESLGTLFEIVTDSSARVMSDDLDQYIAQLDD